MFKIKFKILGKSWTLKLLELKKFEKKHGPEIVGITLATERKINLSPAGFDLETIVHELVHAYIREMCLSTTSDINQNDWEEICAELMAKRGRELLDLADKLFEKVRNLTEAKNVS